MTITNGSAAQQERNANQRYTRPEGILSSHRSQPSMLTSSNALSYKYDSIEEAFPSVEPGLKPFGVNVLVQIRQPKRYSQGGIELVQETRSTEYYNTQVAVVRAMGPLCFHTVKEIDGRDVLVPYAEGPWFEIGSYVRVPKYGGDRFVVDYDHVYRLKNPENDQFENKTEREEAVFCLFKAKDVLGLITGDPLKVKAFLD